MKRRLSFLLWLACAGALFAAPGPLRVAYLGSEQSPASKHCAALMRALGRDAIWFDYVQRSGDLSPELLAKFDAVVLDAPSAAYPLLASVPPERTIAPGPGADEAAWLEADALVAFRQRLLAAAGPTRQKEWEAFLAQREPEVRTADPNVPNYEKRPQAISFQHPFSVAGSMQRTQVPIDCHLELFAADPQIMKPIAFAWDARGRLWVAETRDYPDGLVESGEGNDDIRICEDTDGDGRADKFTVFAERLNLPTSLTFVRGGVIVAQPPRFLFLQDTDGDDKADVRQVILEGWGTRDTHSQASSLHYGYDNWIHGCVGYSGFSGPVGGKLIEFARGTFRMHPDGSALQFLHQFSNNAWGQSQNAAGDDFGGSANAAPLFYGGLSSAICPPEGRIMTAKPIHVEEKAHAITPNFRQVDVFGGYTSAAGSAFLYSANLPPRLQGRVMICEPTMKVISLLNVQPDGAGYVAKDDFNLVASSDEWTSPVFAEVGPDGAVWFADWQNFIVQHNPTPSLERGGYVGVTGPGAAYVNPLRDHLRGRIYRVVWDGAPKRPPVSLEKASTEQLVTALGSDLQERRLTAQRLIVEGKAKEAIPALEKLVTANDGSVAALHALWALDGLGALDDGVRQQALRAKDAALRRNALRSLKPDETGQRLFYGAGAVSDPEPHTRLAALEKLATFPTTPEVQTLVKGLAQDAGIERDEWLREAERLLLLVHQVDLGREGPNLLTGADFETATKELPAEWKPQGDPAVAHWDVVIGSTPKHDSRQAAHGVTTTAVRTSLRTEVPVKPNTAYRLTGWIRTRGFKGVASLQVTKITGAGDEEIRQSDKVTEKMAAWMQVSLNFKSEGARQVRVDLLHDGEGESFFDDVKLNELIPAEGEKLLSGDPARGEKVFRQHPAAACILCHTLHGEGSAVGPALDGIATRAKPEYILESLLEPNKVLAKGYEVLGVSPMPPMGLLLKPQELEDVQAFLRTLK